MTLTGSRVDDQAADSRSTAAAIRAVVLPAVMGLPLRDCPVGRRAPPDFARYVPDHTRLIKTDDFQARSSTALEAAM